MMGSSIDSDVSTAVVDAIESWDPVTGPENWAEDRFAELVGKVFRSQYETDPLYRSFCESRGVEPGDVRSHRDIPAVATEVFKHVELGGVSDPVRVFRTSGTTEGNRGRHAFETLDVYRTSLHPTFVRFCNPKRSRMRMIVCAPSPETLSESSLSFMFGELVERWGDGESDFYVRGKSSDSTGNLDFDFEGLSRALDRAEKEGVTTMVLGTAYGLGMFFEWSENSWKLPAGSRVLETGGFKGRLRKWTAEDLYAKFESRLGVDRERCVSEYSMTELSSQSYTPEIATSGEVVFEAGRSGFSTPPWVRIEIVDPANPALPVDVGREGLIRWYDLANVGSVVAVQTSDLGYRTEREYVVHLGRAEGASLRGCSLTAEEILE